MPRITPGAKTQAAARKVADSDKRSRTDGMDTGGMDPTDQDNTPMPKGPPWQLTEEDLAKLPAGERQAEESLAREIAARQRLSTVRKAEKPGEFTFTSLDDQDDYVVLTMYGPAGTRKTTSLCRMTMVRETGRLLIIAAESGLKKQALQRHGVDTSRVVFWPPRGEKITYDNLEKLFYQLLSDLEKDASSWIGIGWDSLTEIIQMLVDNAAEEDIARMAEIAKKAKKSLDVRKLYQRESTDYQLATGQFRQLLRKYRTLPCHQVFVCLEENRQEVVEADDGSRSKVGVIGPSLTPKVREDVEQHSDVIIRVSVADVPGVGPVGVGRSTPAEDLRAKDRYGVLPLQMIDPGFERVWAYIQGTLKESTDGAQEVAAEASAAVEAPSEIKARQEATREEAKQRRQAARASSPKASPGGKITAESGTPDNPPM